MPWTKKATSNGIHFKQKDAGALIESMVCKINYQNMLQINFSNNVSAEMFIGQLDRIPGVKIRLAVTTVDIVFPSSVKVLNTILQTLGQIETLPTALLDDICSAFNLNDHARLEEMRNELKNRVELLSTLLSNIESAESHRAGNKHELAAEILELLPKESVGKLRTENSRLETFLHTSPMERKREKEREQTATKVVRFSKFPPTQYHLVASKPKDVTPKDDHPKDEHIIQPHQNGVIAAPKPKDGRLACIDTSIATSETQMTEEHGAGAEVIPGVITGLGLLQASNQNGERCLSMP